MDRNSLIGFALLLVLGGAYIFWNSNEHNKYLEQQRADSIAQAQLITETAALQDNQPAVIAESDSLSEEGEEASVATIKEEIISLSNDDIALSFSNKGAHPVKANIKGFKTYTQEELILFEGTKNQLQFNLPIDGKLVPSNELMFEPELIQLADGGQQLKMTANITGNRQVIMDYILPSEGYLMKANMRLIGFDKDLGQGQNIDLAWHTEILQTEKSMESERRNAQIHYKYHNKNHDYSHVQRSSDKKLKRNVSWLATKSHFFSSAIIADTHFENVRFEASEEYDAANGIPAITLNKSSLEIPTSISSDFSFGFRWYIGPNDYKLLQQQDVEDLEELVVLGMGPFFFVKYISKWVIIPLFNILNSTIASIGLVIILLTLIIRLGLSFFTYKSHLSSAKMRVLKPELDELKKKHGDDQQAMGMEQMKLYRTAGVNPLGGCLPLLVQMPFLLSMYYFFPTSMALRQKSFLWADDLSTYDSILNLGFKIPLYGDHVSLFTLLMAISSLVLAKYSQSMAPTAGGENNQMAQMMKYMPYVMPFMFLGWFNNFAAGLTFYYTLSNFISVAQQFVIQKLLIDEDKLLLQIEENKNKPAGQSKWQQRLEEMQKMQAEKAKQGK